MLWKENRSDIALNVLTRTSYPSLLYMYNNGPGTIWETWNADGRIASNNGLTSLNHVMFGGGPAVWCYNGVAGISALKPGYEEIKIRPEIVGDLTSANGSVMTPRGMVSNNWIKVSSSQVNLNVTIPVNSKAIVYVPTLGNTNARIREGGEVIYNGGFSGGVNGIESLHSASGDFIAFNVGSGSYSFVMTGDGNPIIIVTSAPTDPPPIMTPNPTPDGMTPTPTPAPTGIGDSPGEGYIRCANEGESFTLPGVCDVAYGAQSSYNYLYDKSGTITFNNDTFGDPIYGVEKSGYYKLITP